MAVTDPRCLYSIEPKIEDSVLILMDSDGLSFLGYYGVFEMDADFSIN